MQLFVGLDVSQVLTLCVIRNDEVRASAPLPGGRCLGEGGA